MHTIVNCTTGESVTIPYTAEEIAQREQDIANANARREAIEAEKTTKAALKTSAKAKLVAGEPLTEEEAATIVL
jgi:hypothetical protein